MGFYDLERAARDLNYRIMYEHQQRQDKFDREVRETRTRAAASSTPAASRGNQSASSFMASASSVDVPPSGTGVAPSPAAGSSDDLPEAAYAILVLGILFMFGSGIAALFMGGFTWGRAVAASLAIFLALWLITRYWRPILAMTAALAALHIARTFFG